MRIAYFAQVQSGSELGVFHKIAGQVGEWRRHGHEARVFLATAGDADAWRQRLGDAVVRRYDGPMSRELALAQLVLAAHRHSPDLLYFRFSLVHPPVLGLGVGVPTVIEVNTDDTHETALWGSARSLYNAATRDVVLRRADAMVFVTTELSTRAAFASFTRRRSVITNGIALDEYPELPVPAGAPPRLVFVGSAGQPWHGIDKLLTLAERRPRWQFDIVGSRDDSGRAPSNIIWHGALQRAAVLDVLALAHVGVGTLALHRNSLDEASTLKIREYLAVGLPVIYGYHDPDADGLGDLSLRIPNCESNVTDSLEAIDRFVEASVARRVPRSSIAHIDVSAKEQQRLELFQAVLDT